MKKMDRLRLMGKVVLVKSVLHRIKDFQSKSITWKEKALRTPRSG